MQISIVVPTYKEQENIQTLFERIFKVFKEHKIDGEIIVVDDDSNDGTEETVNKFTERHPVNLIVRKNEKGLASACIKGFDNAKGDIILVMDADLQHPPEKIPELISAIENGADIAIGSRHVEGGSLGDWNIIRKTVSWGAGFLANTLFSEIKNVKDKESGFFAFKKEVIANVDLRPKGYKILLEILVLGNYKNVKEIGFTFGLRNAGKSKLGISIIFSYIYHLITLLWHSGKLKLFAKFCIVGLVGVGVNLGILYFLTNKLGYYYMYSGVVAIEISLLANFFMNRAWTFKKEAENISFKKAIMMDHITRFLGILINYVCLFVFTEYFSFYYMLSMLIGIILSTGWNFVGNTKWVWVDKNNN